MEFVRWTILRNVAPICAAIAGIGATILFADAAQAAPTTLEFDGSVNSVDPALTGTFGFGDPVSIRLVYDAATPDALPADPNLAVYDFISFDLRFGSYTASFSSNAAGGVGIVVLNNADQGLGPADAFGASAAGSGAGAPVGGLPLQQGFVSLWDFTQTAFTGTSLPAPPAFDQFSYRVAGMTFCTSSGCGVGQNPNSVFAEITSMSSVTAVPEPAIWALMLPALAMVGLRRRRRTG